MANRWGNNWNSERLLFWAPKSLQMVIAAMKLKDTYSLEGGNTMANLDSILRSRDIMLPTKVCVVKAMVFPVVMHGYESWTIKKTWVTKNWCFWTVVMEDCKIIKPVIPKGNQPWIFIERTDAEAEAPILRRPDVKNCLIWKYLDTWRHEEKGTTEDEMVEWHHQMMEIILSMFQELVMDRELVSYCTPCVFTQLDMT